MNERIKLLAEQATTYIEPTATSGEGWIFNKEKFAELIVRECISILETEIELVKGYKSTAHNVFDVRWHDGKIEHFAKLIEKNKKHFGVKE